MLFHVQVMILVLGAGEHRKQLGVVGFLGVVVLFLTTTNFFVEGSITISGMCETKSFVEFCSLLMGCFKIKKVTSHVLLLSLHEIWRRKLRP